MRLGFGSGRSPFDRGHIRFFGNGGWRFRPYGESLFLQAPKKSNQKNARPERTAPRLGSGFLRSGVHPGALPSGRLRFDLHAMSSTASNGAARPSPDEHLRSACRGGGWIKIKSGRRANARPVEWWGCTRANCRSCRRLRSFDLDLPPPSTLSKIKIKRSQPSAAPTGKHSPISTRSP